MVVVVVISVLVVLSFCVFVFCDTCVLAQNIPISAPKEFRRVL